MDKRTPLFDEHLKLCATIIPFGGWEMPVYYTSVLDEHAATREAAGIFDTCHMGEIEVSGPQSFEFTQGLVTCDIAKLKPGAAVYGVLTNERGGCVDDLWVYLIEPGKYFLCVNASTKDKDWQWLNLKAPCFNVTLKDLSAETGMIALQGPAAVKIMADVAEGDMPARFHFSTMEIAGVSCMVSRTGYTGEDGVEIYAPACEAPKLWQALLEAGKPRGLKPVGLGARDTLRLEAGYSLYGHELNENITPVEAGISFAVSRGKGAFSGSDVILKQISEGPEKRVAAFELTERGVPREHYPILAGGVNIGETTSGCYSPTLKKGIGLAMIDASRAEIGSDISVEIRGRLYAGKIVKRPFIQFRGGK